jgi:hypothetical protein
MEPHQKNKYEILILPFDYNNSFLDMQIDEINNYYQWFLSIKKDRINHICNFIFLNYNDCLNEKKLDIVETFLLNNVSSIAKPKENLINEIQKIPIHLLPYANPDNYLLDKKTISICYDIGIYLGEQIISIDNKINWKVESDDISADYGQLILVKKGIKLKLNPFRVVKNIAASIIENKYGENELANVFSTWKRLYKTEL